MICEDRRWRSVRKYRTIIGGWEKTAAKENLAKRSEELRSRQMKTDVISPAPAKKNCNVGCGQSPTKGWTNYDNSFCVKLARRPVQYFLMKLPGLLNGNQVKFVKLAKECGINWADITKRIPESDNSVDVIYLSHVLENLDHNQTKQFLKESLRVLKPSGIIRISAQDIKRVVERYNQDGDADLLVHDFYYTINKKITLLDKVKILIFGDRNRKWFYDARSLEKLLSKTGFVDAREFEPGTTGIENPGELDLKEQLGKSMYIEAKKS